MIQSGADQQSGWQVLDEEPVLDHPFVTVTMQHVQLPDGQNIPDWPKIYTHDFVNAVIVNEAREALVLEGYKHGTGRICWQMIGGYIEPGEDPLTAVQRELLEETGYHTDEWVYLGSYIVDPNRHIGVGHFFCAQQVRLITEPNHNDLEAFTLKWVSLKELQYALLDGRLAAISYATSVALALLTILK